MFNLRSLDLNLLTVFEAIYEIGTVSGAADRLALSQSAASHALARLRDACKDDLFVRVHQGLSPTPPAKEMYPAIKQALDALRTTLAEASGFDPQTSQRRFRISIPHPMGPFYAIGLRAAVAAVAPSVVLTFDTVSRPLDLEESLRDGSTDSNVPMNLGIPAVTISGGGKGTGAHSLGETFDTTDSWIGTQRALLLAISLAR